ncbi:DUF6707 family protein [Erwinia billingiae]|uniref:DUF6707 family protein n=1 Tax=Erwinia billingiae TaxID=182337 RepID=UPI003D180265
MESLTKFAYIFYVFDELKNSELIIDKLSVIQFENDYDYWIWLEYAISLRAEIAKLNGDSVNFDDSIKKYLMFLILVRGFQGAHAW